jgi:hypothetical protein
MTSFKESSDSFVALTSLLVGSSGGRISISSLSDPQLMRNKTIKRDR